MKAPATLLAPPGVKHGFINNSSAPMVVSGNFPALDVETKTETKTEAKTETKTEAKTETKAVLAGGYASIGGRYWPPWPAVVSAEQDTYRGLPSMTWCGRGKRKEFPSCSSRHPSR